MNEQEWTSRTELLLTKQRQEILKKCRVLIVGLGGVGGYAAEQLVRAGIGTITLIDNDQIHLSNINRQIIALNSTLGILKTEAFKTRFLDINPTLNIDIISLFVEGDNILPILQRGYDYVVDAIDTLTPKVDLLEACIKTKTPVVSSMGSGGRMNPEQIKTGDIKESHHCKFAYLVRKYLHRRGIFEGIKVVYSTEEVPEIVYLETDGSNHKRTIVGTISYMPAIFGCYCSSIVVRDLCAKT